MSGIEEQNLLQRIEQALKNEIRKSRYLHTKGVLTAAMKLAEQYGADPHKTAVAALFHDYAKDYSREKLFQTAEKYRIDIDPLMRQAYQILHGKMAAAIASHEFGVQDAEVLLAIESHTTGRKGMGLIEKIIYLADFIEPGRNYPGVEQLRRLAEEDLEMAVYRALTNTMIYVLRTGKLLHPNTLEARNEMLLEMQRITVRPKENTNGKGG